MWSEVVRHASSGYQLNTIGQLLITDGHITDPDNEAISGQRAARKFPSVGMGFEDLELRGSDCRPSVQRLRRLRDRKPLDGDCAPVFQAGKSDIHRTAATNPCKLSSYPLGIRIPLADFQQDMLPRAGGCKTQVFLYDKVIRLDSQ